MHPQAVLSSYTFPSVIAYGIGESVMYETNVLK